jgi:hypothetical protein
MDYSVHSQDSIRIVCSYAQLADNYQRYSSVRIHCPDTRMLFYIILGTTPIAYTLIEGNFASSPKKSCPLQYIYYTNCRAKVYSITLVNHQTNNKKPIKISSPTSDCHRNYVCPIKVSNLRNSCNTTNHEDNTAFSINISKDVT